MDYQVKITAAFPAPGSGPAGLAWDGTNLWQADYGDGRIYALDPATAVTRRSLYCPGRLSGLTGDGQMLWQLALDRESGRAVRSLPVPVGTGDIDFHDGSLWAGVAEPLRYDHALGRFEWEADRLEYAVLRINPADGRVIARYAAAHFYSGLCWAGDDLWLAYAPGKTLYRAALA